MTVVMDDSGPGPQNACNVYLCAEHCSRNTSKTTLSQVSAWYKSYQPNKEVTGNLSATHTIGSGVDLTFTSTPST